MKNKTNIMIDPPQHEHLKRIAENKKITFSQLVCDAAEKCYPQIKENHTVILKIPKNLENIELKSWLESATKSLLKNLTKI